MTAPPVDLIRKTILSKHRFTKAWSATQEASLSRHKDVLTSAAVMPRPWFAAVWLSKPMRSKLEKIHLPPGVPDMTLLVKISI